MTPAREAFGLPLTLLTVVLLGGIRLTTPVAILPPTLFSLVLASVLLAVFTQSGAVDTSKLMHADRPAWANVNGLLVLLTLFLANAQVISPSDAGGRAAGTDSEPAVLRGVAAARSGCPGSTALSSGVGGDPAVGVRREIHHPRRGRRASGPPARPGLAGARRWIDVRQPVTADRTTGGGICGVHNAQRVSAGTGALARPAGARTIGNRNQGSGVGGQASEALALAFCLTSVSSTPRGAPDLASPPSARC